jgi:hypothetical protein
MVADLLVSIKNTITISISAHLAVVPARYQRESFSVKTCKLQSVGIDFKITTGKSAQVMPVSMGDHGPNTGIRLLIQRGKHGNLQAWLVIVNVQKKTIRLLKKYSQSRFP